MEPDEVLAEVAREVAICTKCQLCKMRKKAVPGEGPATAEILFIGEGPGYYENEQGRPFVGAAGQFLDELLQSIHLKRSDVFITNVVKCRPPNNRDPLPEEISTCTNYYLNRQIEAINPKMIVTLGRFSMGLFFPNARISQVHGRPMRVNGRVVVPMFHPAAALHQPSLRSAVEADFARLPQWIEKMNQAPEAARQGTLPMGQEPPAEEKKGEEPKQLSLF
ncbi:MAG TPA: uracil-DNA glycosylase [Anaerolineaceae bacterium]|nr:uracil-DNA glycosylase [Anaerolineaceae bacterium]